MDYFIVGWQSLDVWLIVEFSIIMLPSYILEALVSPAYLLDYGS